MNPRPPWMTALWYGAAIGLGAVAIGPAAWLLLIAIQPAGRDMNSLDGVLGGGLTLRNFADAWTSGQLARPLINSVVVTVARATLNVIIASLAAYPLARMRFRGRHTLFLLLIATMMIPEQVIVVPMFRVVVSMGLYDTLLAVVIPFSVTAFGIYLCRQAFLAIPEEMEEAARMDGAGSLRVWWHVMLPLAAPTLSTLALFSIIGAWSELLWPLIVLQGHDKMTLPVAVNLLLGQFSTNLRTAYAGAALALVPVVLVFIVTQRFLRTEIFAGAVKG